MKFYVAEEEKPWIWHLKNARKMGCELASMEDQVEQDAAKDAIISSPADRNTWIGLYRPNDSFDLDDPYRKYASGGWRWTDETHFPTSDSDGFEAWRYTLFNSGPPYDKDTVYTDGTYWYESSGEAWRPGLYKCCIEGEDDYEACPVPAPSPGRTPTPP